MGISDAIPAGSIAGGVGIKTTNKQFGGAVSRLAVRIAILAQHRTGIEPLSKGFSYDLPTQIISPENAAEFYGFGSPIHLATLRLYDSNQSIGTIPVDVFAIKESDSGKSKGTLTLDVQPTDADPMTVDTKTYIFQDTLVNADGNIQIGATLAETQANLIAAFNLSGQAGVQYAALMTFHPTVDIAAFAADNAVLTAKLSGVAGDTIVTVETFTAGTNIFDAATLGTTQAGAPTTALGSIGFIGTQTIGADYTLKIGSEVLRFNLARGETALQAATKIKALIDGNIKIALSAGTIAGDAIPFTANWAGITGDEIGIEFQGLTQGIAVVITPMTGGVGVPSIENALSNFQINYTDVLNGFGDTGSLDFLEVRNEELWVAEEHRPYLAYFGSKETDPVLVSADTETRLNQRTNVKFPVLGSPSVLIEIAASLVALVTKTKNEDPAQPYYDAPIFGITPGNENVVQWDFTERDFIEKRGCSTSFVNNGLVIVGGVLTTSHPTGLDNPGFRYAVDIAKLQKQIFDLDQLFTGPKWIQKILVGDRDVVSNINARKPLDAKGDVFALIDIWANTAIVVGKDELKENVQVEIDPANSKRLNVVVPSRLSGDSRIRSINLDFSTEVGGN